MSLEKLRNEVFDANMALVEDNLVVLTWGNASGIDRERGVVAIKPSGIGYAVLRPKDLVIVDLDGAVVEGELRPSSDTPTHIALYRAWPEIGGVVHTHSTHATVYAQAGMPIPCLGTTHADFCPGDIPCVRALAKGEVEEDYEGRTGAAIVEHYGREGLQALEYPGAVLTHHGPFAWGKTPHAAVENAVILESVARMALLTRLLNPAAGAIPSFIIDKHYLRKHGPSAYYGQA